MKTGQIIQYIIADHCRRKAIPIELIDDKTTYDSKRYIELLAQTSNSVTEPFGLVIST
ncbi:MAG: hypothetical protein HRF40_11670 [Nitrososphaera sp.]|jgi:DNA polymerase elongation subunit (family B)